MNRLNDSVVSLAEFYAPSPMQKFYCRKVTRDEYEYQMVNETEKAIKELIVHLDKNPEVYRKALSKRKQEEMENSSVFTMLKLKLLASLKGSAYQPGQVTEEELQDKLDDLKTGMLMAFNYAQAEVKQKRYYTRLAARRAKMSGNDENAGAGGKKQKLVPQAPPPPPVPPPGIIPSAPPLPANKPAPLVERDINITTSSPCAEAKPRRPLRPTDSTSSMNNVHDEILSFNSLTRLKSTKQSRSPGGTPIRKADTPLNLLRSRMLYDNSMNTPDRLNSSEPLTTAFLRIMEQKFRNVRSPSPSVDHNLSQTGSPATPSEFSP